MGRFYSCTREELVVGNVNGKASEFLKAVKNYIGLLLREMEENAYVDIRLAVDGQEITAEGDCSVPSNQVEFLALVDRIENAGAVALYGMIEGMEGSYAEYLYPFFKEDLLDCVTYKKLSSNDWDASLYGFGIINGTAYNGLQQADKEFSTVRDITKWVSNTHDITAETSGSSQQINKEIGDMLKSVDQILTKKDCTPYVEDEKSDFNEEDGYYEIRGEKYLDVEDAERLLSIFNQVNDAIKLNGGMFKLALTFVPIDLNVYGMLSFYEKEGKIAVGAARL